MTTYINPNSASTQLNLAIIYEGEGYSLTGTTAMYFKELKNTISSHTLTFGWENAPGATEIP